jgi:MFS family permease
VCYGIFGPFAWLYALEYLRLGKLGANLYLMVLPMLAMTVVFPLWGRTVDRYGCRPTLAVAWIGLLVFPAAWFFATPGHTWWLAGVGLVVGGFLAGAQVAEFDLMFSMTPVAQRSVYVASVAVVSGLFAAGAPAMGGALAQALKGVHVPLWGMTITNLHVLLLISLALRIAHILYFVPRLPETRAEPAMRLALDLLRAPFGALAARLTWPDWAPRSRAPDRKPPEDV